MVQIPFRGRIYVASVTALGLSATAFSVYSLWANPVGYDWLFLAALTLVSGSATLRLQSVSATISVSETFVFTSILLFGPATGIVIVALDGLVMSYWVSKRRRLEADRLLFNISAPALSVWVAAHLFYATANVAPLSVTATPITTLAPHLLLATTAYFLCNSSLTAFAISFERNVRPFTVWKDFWWLAPNYFGGASLAMLFVGYTRVVDFGYLVIIVPLLVVIYLTFKTSLARMDDARQHLGQINRLYLSTIETLAMAIDAKDQVTHGHIRRVQIYAVGLAKALGVDDDEVQAVEAAALLHDMGKLAIPEDILNKPGRLSPIERRKMRRHAIIGAEILSAIEFPFPVVPIVRHHHEFWNGRGYPDALSETRIPIGARILTVVDNFDALTSDRPYRRALSTEDALDYLKDGAGTLFDPEVVATFVEVHEEIAPTQADLAGRQAISKIMETELRHLREDGGDRAASAQTDSREQVALKQLAEQLGDCATVAQVGGAISHYVSPLLPSDLCALYMPVTGTNRLVAEYASGSGADDLRGNQVGIGKGITGWVGLRHESIVSSDPGKDFGVGHESLNRKVRGCLSTPLLDDGVLTGVLTIYSETSDVFTDEHTRISETVAGLASPVLASASHLRLAAPAQ